MSARVAWGWVAARAAVSAQRKSAATGAVGAGWKFLARSAGAALGMLLLVAGVAGGQQGASRTAAPVGVVRQDAPIRMGVTVQPDTVTVGDPFIVSIRVQAAAGAQITFPDPPDSTATVQALDPVQHDASADTTVTDRTARYRLAAWDTGLQPVEFSEVTVRTTDGTRQVPVENVVVYVQSVLPADSSEHIPRDAREPFEFPGPWWLPWLLALLAAAVVGTLFWWWWRRRGAAEIVEERDPAAEAEQAFARVEAMHLLEAGEHSRYIALVIEVLREFLAARDPAASTSLTTRELLAVLHGSTLVPLERLQTVLREADLVKFANRDAGVKRAREIGAECRTLVQHVESAYAAAIAAAAAEAEREARTPAGREAA